MPSIVEINQVFLKKMIKCEKFSTSNMIMTIGSDVLKRLMPFTSEYVASSFKVAQEFWRRWFLNIVNVFVLFG